MTKEKKTWITHYLVTTVVGLIISFSILDADALFFRIFLSCISVLSIVAYYLLRKYNFERWQAGAILLPSAVFLLSWFVSLLGN
jgi:hypothetical protein